MSASLDGNRRVGFTECVEECIRTAGFVSEWERLYGKKLIRPRSPIEQMVDKATGYDVVIQQEQREAMGEFIAFVLECVWCPLKFQEMKEAK